MEYAVVIGRKTIFSADRIHRYTLWREWAVPTASLFYTADPHLTYYPGQHNQFAMFIGLNPSTADETKDDPTIRKCIGFAQRWGFGALCMCNIFAFRATDPKDMRKATDPIGDDNWRHVTKCALEAGMIVAAWGVNGAYKNQGECVLMWLRECGLGVKCLRVTNGGFPEHPLYVPYDTLPVEYDAVKNSPRR